MPQHKCSEFGSKIKVQILPNATPPIGKIHPFSKITVTFERLMQFLDLLGHVLLLPLLLYFQISSPLLFLILLLKLSLLDMIFRSVPNMGAR